MPRVELTPETLLIEYIRPILKRLSDAERELKELQRISDTPTLSAVPSADNGLYWKDEYDRAVNEISELQAQLYDAEEEIRGLQNEIKRGIDA